MNGTELRNLRRAAGVAMADLMEPLGCSEITISRYERGLSPVPAGFSERYQQEVARITERRAQAARMVQQEYRDLTEDATPDAEMAGVSA